jgi:hypothetical protein
VGERLGDDDEVRRAHRCERKGEKKEEGTRSPEASRDEGKPTREGQIKVGISVQARMM